MSKEMASDNNGIRLSGFGLPLERESKLPVAQGWFPSPMTVRERAMLGLMAALKDKPEWDRKVFNEEIVAKWRQEALSFIPDHDPISVEGETDPWEGNARENGENLNIDGESRQKAISEKVFDYVCLSHCCRPKAVGSSQLNETRSVLPNYVIMPKTSSNVASQKHLMRAHVSICLTQRLVRR